MECAPTVRADVVSDALPPLIAAVPRELAPSRNCTVPVATEGDTDAVKVTDWPNVEEGSDEATVVVVLARDWPHESNRNDPMRVLQPTTCVLA